MKTLKLHQANWTSHHLASKQIKAFIGLGANPAEEGLEPEILYIATLTNMDNEELLTKDFEDLDTALDHLNSSYGHWDLTTSSDKDESDGCSTCSAH